MPLDYALLRKELRWNCADHLFKDGADHYEVDGDRFERAARAIGSLNGKVVADVGSFPGFGIWAFRDCKRYIGVGKCPQWYQDALASRFGVEWLDWDFESPQPPPRTLAAPDVVVLQEVIEHIRQPRKFLTKLHGWMPIGAKLYVTTNNLSYIGYILKQVVGKEIFDCAMSEDTEYPGHGTYYSLAGLAKLLGDIGFNVRSSAASTFFLLRAFIGILCSVWSRTSSYDQFHACTRRTLRSSARSAPASPSDSGPHALELTYR